MYEIGRVSGRERERERESVCLCIDPSIGP